MIEEGIVRHIQAGLALADVSVPGGFAYGEMPKDQIKPASPQAWTWRTITTREDLTLAGRSSWTEWYVQLDCHGRTMADAMSLARAIDAVLRAFTRQRLTDPDQTFVDAILFEDMNEGFNDDSRSFVRSLDYRILYHQP